MSICLGMPKDLKDQLSAWNAKNTTKLPSNAPKTAAERREEARVAAVQKAERERIAEESLDDESLFARAVAGIDGKSKAILSKYDQTLPEDDSPADARPAAAASETSEEGEAPKARPRADPDATLFLDAIGDIPRHPTKKK